MLLVPQEGPRFAGPLCVEPRPYARTAPLVLQLRDQVLVDLLRQLVGATGVDTLVASHGNSLGAADFGERDKRLLGHYRRGEVAAFRLGSGHGLFCLGCCWALMLVMFGVGVAVLWWMAALTALMVYENIGGYGDSIVRPVGAVLLGVAALQLGHPTWLPVALGGSKAFPSSLRIGARPRE